jgi:BolA family transcriptional regulator, general stress-responsive regulator
MMTPAQRIAEIKKRVTEKFSPLNLEVIDDSAKHAGHAGSKSGAGHYQVIITAISLQNKSRIDAHREIYAVLADLIPAEIHALQIKIQTI